ncbi:hypothetical protein ACFU8X_29415 [Brevibacillus porteri]|uniref:hypothetical protein n=1 Tax=Brevibacillus porteri TaxID=2126350 RepID=UPI00370A4C29
MSMFQQRMIITNDEIPRNDNYKGLRILDCFNDANAYKNYQQHVYQFQDNPTGLIPIRCTLSRKGSPPYYRLVAFCHPTLQQFVDIVRYDPSRPDAVVGYESTEIQMAHKETQSDFRGSKASNLQNFKEYILEGITGDRTLFLPTVCGWQPDTYFDEAIFVSLDGVDPNALYGILYLPKRAIMQSDGQTQTAALFRALDTEEALQNNAGNSVTVTLEIELKVNGTMAGVSFADRNGRGSKKNLNLVKKLDVASPLGKLRHEVVLGTIFEHRLADGRNTGTSVTATTNIVDLNTMSLMILEAVSNGRLGPNDLKHHHIPHFLPFAKEFLQLLEDVFAHDWKDPTPRNEDPYRKLYVHGWPFALKALGKVYYCANEDVLAPLISAINDELRNKDHRLSVSDNLIRVLNEEKSNYDKVNRITMDEFKDRLRAIDWLRYRKHWINITGHSRNKDGTKRTFIVKNTNEEQVVALAQNNASFISAVVSKIMSDTWTELCQTENEPLN